tara:strand:+ start:430 stop:708 length:279 start_codon:yes stop_codon:yes gene_type:complete
MGTFQPSITYYNSEHEVTVKIEDLSAVELVLGDEVIVLEDAVDDYLRLKAEEKKAEELVEEYKNKEACCALNDAPAQQPDDPTWDRWLKLVN